MDAQSDDDQHGVSYPSLDHLLHSYARTSLQHIAVSIHALLTWLQDHTLPCGPRGPKERVNVTTFGAENPIIASLVAMGDTAVL